MEEIHNGWKIRYNAEKKLFIAYKDIDGQEMNQQDADLLELYKKCDKIEKHVAEFKRIPCIEYNGMRDVTWMHATITSVKGKAYSNDIQVRITRDSKEIPSYQFRESARATTPLSDLVQDTPENHDKIQKIIALMTQIKEIEKTLTRFDKKDFEKFA